ncbi:CheR family methyltransferase [Chondromyces apiculatus]|uniref:Chemotaxis protein methyltransferase CheR n=1 Tax=Chondromyces apiculatus DSM 436 TaxID=1192034 RepID=A0A017SXL8_9BACT|nr:protein-glutamate O-methyltransferase CheR [Chondromyces apiculatus]EYF01026.1 Chemotaxis protein methyltransferase CheR [Chondromyces apiculatus DSM 436]
MAAEDLSQLEDLLEARFGLSCSGWQRDALARAVTRWRERAASAGAGGLSVVTPEEVQRVVSEILVRETYFFRDQRQIEAMVDVALQERARVGAPGRPLRVLSAGCASGEEPYSLAITLQERAGHLAGRTWIHGVDISEEAVEHAREGVYGTWALRATPEATRARCFRAEGERFRLRDEHRARVSFERRNLLEPDPDFWKEGAFDVIFCRNVTLYFSERAIRSIFARFAAALAPGGFLFVGASETLRGLSDDFELSFHGDTALHRRRSEEGLLTRVTPGILSVAWMEDIQQASARVEMLTATKPGSSAAGVAVGMPAGVAVGMPAGVAVGMPAGVAAGGEEGPPLAQELRRLITAERYSEGLSLIRQASLLGEGRADLQLFEAIMLSGLGRVGELERVCARLNALHGEHAGAEYLLGLCREYAGDRAGAARLYRDALRTDPHFAMARLRLGLQCKAAGDLRGARTELREALAGLRVGPEEHVALFGGGFSRAALTAMCRAELSAVETSR